jgi:hypothetical protein
VGIMSRPLLTAREPFCWMVSCEGCEGSEAHWWAEVFLQIYNDQCGLEIVSRHSDLGVANWERGVSADADGFVFGEMQPRELRTTPPTLQSRGSGWSHDFLVQLTTTLR